MAFKKLMLLLVCVGMVYAPGSTAQVSISSQMSHIPSSLSPSTGTLCVFAYYAVKQADGSYVGSFVQVPVIVTGPENHTGITTADRWNPLNFTVAPGEYIVSGIYDSATPQTASVNVSAGDCVDVLLNFSSFPPPPSVPIDFSNSPRIAWINETVVLNAAEQLYVGRRKVLPTV